MKILIFSFRYEPFNSIGVNRITSLVDYLKRKNVEYLVITAYSGYHNNSRFNEDVNVIYIPWFDVKKLKLINSNHYLESNTIDYDASRNKIFSLLSRIIGKLLSLFFYPDPYLNWTLRTISTSDCQLKDFKPDLIYSSSYPYSSHIPAYYFSKKYKIPWIAELRDPWVYNHVRKKNVFSTFIDKSISRYLFKETISLVTVTESWQKQLKELYNKETLLIRNGFGINIPAISPSINIQFINKKSNKQKILYTGSIFPDNQDITSFLRWLLSDNDVFSKYEFIYVGSGVKIVKDILIKYNLSFDGKILLIDKVSFYDSLWLQKNVDFLLLFNWSGSQGVIPGKFYEYIGANKPIILWNNKINNELVDICRNLNKCQTGDKVLIIDEIDTAKYKLINFHFNPDSEIIRQYSREYQFDILLKSMFSHVKK